MSDWIKDSIKNPGSFRREAKKNNLSTKAFTKKVLNNKKQFSTTTVRRATLARTLMKFSKK